MSLITAYAEFNTLSSIEKDQLLQMIQKVLLTSSISINSELEGIRESRFLSGVICPHCGCEHVVGHGKYRGRQRYKCKSCLITFNDLSFSPMSGTHYQDKWPEYVELMCESRSIPYIAQELNISVPTAFYWRHKILNSMKKIDLNQVYGIIESDEKFFKESFKGQKKLTSRKAYSRGGSAQKRGISDEQVCVVVAMSRDGEILSKKAGKGRITADQIDSAIGKYISPNSVLCSDSATNYRSFAIKKGLQHEKVNAKNKKYVVNKIYHIQHVNSYHERLETWINRHFRGVSTKYLDNYLVWSRFLELNKKLDINNKKKKLFLTMFLGNISTVINCF